MARSRLFRLSNAVARAFLVVPTETSAVSRAAAGVSASASADWSGSERLEGRLSWLLRRALSRRSPLRCFGSPFLFSVDTTKKSADKHLRCQAAAEQDRICSCASPPPPPSTRALLPQSSGPNKNEK